VNSERKTSHRFLDEVGDTTFFGKGRIVSVGRPGVSLSFALGMVKFEIDLRRIRREIKELQKVIENDEYLNKIPSVRKRIEGGGFFFHATDDTPEVRERLIRYIKETPCSLEMIIGRKIPSLFAKKHHNKETEFYADMLSHLLKNKFMQDQKLVLNIAERGSSTQHVNLQHALEKAIERFAKTHPLSEISSQVVFNVQNPRTEPLLCISDYLCWSVHRVFERGETRHYEYLKEKVALVIDLYDTEHYDGFQNYYGRKKELTKNNKLSPPSS